MREPNLWRRGETWWLRAIIKGREYRESLRTGDLKTARRLRDARIEEIKAAKFRGERARSWLEAVVEWADHSRDQIAASTAKRYAVSLEQARPLLEKFNVDEINGEVIADLMTAGRKRGATAATIRRDLTAVSRVLEYAEAMGWREGNPTLSKRRILKERRDPITLPRHEDIETIIAASSPQFGALIRAAWLTGCRQDELVTAKWRGFNAAGRTLEVIGKGNKRRVITLSAPALAHLQSVPRVLGSNLIFCKTDGEPFTQAASDFTHIRRGVAAQARQSGRQFVRFRFHDLRHLFAVEALQSGSLSIYGLSKHLGHTSVKTTEIYLAFLTPEQAARVKENPSQNRAQ
jgi:integrase/recombinase XerD